MHHEEQTQGPAPDATSIKPSRRSVLISMAAAGVAAGSPWAVGAASAAASPRIDDIYLLIGQSNMAGRAPIEEQDRPVLPGVYLFDAAGQWTPASNEPRGFNRYSTVEAAGSRTQLGPGYTFARHLHAATGRQIGLVVNARGGTSISQWRKHDYAGDYALYAEAVSRAQEALRRNPSARLRGIIWHQGESDNRASAADYYMPTLRRMVESMREDLQSESAVFVAGEVGTWQGRGAHINPLIRTTPDHLHSAGWVSSEGLTTHETDHDPWGPHFDPASQRIFGVRYAEAVLDLVPQW